ncbi:hypothetical protein Moror_4878 [Moniliophthora roreri MCA 2997]|uniref:Uncharacterized protein n=2 Tax=Moniliophthora roreri TaxID=221103 RepID=V2W9L2_MONRO|nr:hypothetical protein Moror_4878 [Moniliophthora roreri MCA 2997]KAI3605490.1 hypothetical protein WG66_005935 [Moniliophthora roreri]
MEVVFDNKSNVLNAKLHTMLDDAVIYTLETNYGFRGRRFTLLRDTNPLPGRRQSTAGSATGVTVGAINWREKTMEVNGVRKKIADLKRRKGNYFSNTRCWQWSTERKEYELKYKDDEWKATFSQSENSAMTNKGKEPSKKEEKHSSDSTSPSDPSNGDGSTTLDPMESIDGPEQDDGGLIGRFQVPFRPHLFTKSKPPKLRIKRAGLTEDEVFLILIFIYSEVKRQDQTNSSVTSEGA